MTTSTSGPATTYASGFHRGGWMAFGFVALAFGVTFIVTAFTLTDPPRRIGIAAVCVVLTVLSLLCARASLVVNTAAGMVQVRNPFRTQQIPIADLDDFEATVLNPPLWGRIPIVQIRRKSGRVVRCHGLTEARFGDCLRRARELNAAAGLGQRVAVSAVHIADPNKALASYARLLNKRPTNLLPFEVQLYETQRALCVRQHRSGT